MSEADLDGDLDGLEFDALLGEAKRMRRAIRTHRDSTGQELCWHHPAMWDLLPDKKPIDVIVPDWPQFMRGCIRYRTSLDEQLPKAPRTTREYGE